MVTSAQVSNQAAKTKDGSLAIEHLVSFADMVPFPSFFVDVTGKITFLNQRGQEFFDAENAVFGFGATQVLGQNFSTTFSAFTSLTGTFQQVNHQEVTVDFSNNGRDFQVSFRPTFDDTDKRIGTVVGWLDSVGSSKEFVELKGMKDAIGKSQAVIEFELDGTIITANDSFLSVVGYTLDEIRGQHHRMFVEDAFVTSSEYKQFWEKMNRGEYEAKEYKRIGKGGKEVWLQASYNPILDLDGKPFKVVKFATDVTEIKLLTLLGAMVDKMPINVIMANTDLEITYMNPASMEQLATLEQHLPVKSSEIVGQSIDIFHKNPAHQKSILSNPDNLPHRAQIKLGPEVLDLAVNAIRDNEGNYIGPMVTWSVLTAKVKLVADFETNVKAVVENVAAAATEMQATSKNMAANTDETSRQSQVVAAASEEATKNVETVASAAEELSASISEIAKHVQNASEMTSEAVRESEKTNVIISDLAVSSNEIGQVVKVITSIAQQTNLLALNATIEAARAGEAGKGFAVVANEVKELARQTAKATEEISEKISAIQSATGGASTAIEMIGSSIGKINEISTTIAGAVEEQTAATNEISRNVTEAARGTAEVSSNITGVSQAADEGGKGANAMMEASDGLAKEASTLATVTDQFLEIMKEL